MNQSQALFHLAQQYIPGGVNSPVRAFHGVGGTPVFIQSGHDAYLVDVDGKEYVDYVGSWGPLIGGHAHPYVIEKIIETLQRGFSFGAPTELEVKLAQTISAAMPSMEMMRFVNSGTEATMSAIRLARGYTKRNKLIKFAGCYHGHADSLLVSAGSGALTLGVPSSLGVPESIAQHTLVADYNQLDETTALFAKYGDDIACVIVEPVAGNMNCVLPKEEFLPGLRSLCDRYGSLLIFDEVMTGFRIAKGGAQAHFAIQPDLTTLGKIIGGGFPVGAFGGRAHFMHAIAPLGAVYQAGTLSGNPVAMAGGLATLELLRNANCYEELAKKTQQLITGLMECAEDAGVAFHAHAIGSMFGIFFTEQREIFSLPDVMRCNVPRFKQFFHGMLQQGIYFAPSAFEAGFLSLAHGEDEINQTLNAAAKVFASLVT